VDPAKREGYLVALMAPPNRSWYAIVEQAMQSSEVLKQQEAIKSIQNVLQVRDLLHSHPDMFS
jgi:hypothetical protein